MSCYPYKENLENFVVLNIHILKAFSIIFFMVCKSNASYDNNPFFYPPCSAVSLIIEVEYKQIFW